jgi:hypothetical protein
VSAESRNEAAKQGHFSHEAVTEPDEVALPSANLVLQFDDLRAHLAGLKFRSTRCITSASGILGKVFIGLL